MARRRGSWGRYGAFGPPTKHWRPPRPAFSPLAGELAGIFTEFAYSREGVLHLGDQQIAEVLYVFSFPSCPDLLKIGYSGQGLEKGRAEVVLPRVIQQTTGFPERPELLLVYHSARAWEIEQALHRTLDSRRVEGSGGKEWFKATLPEVISAAPELRAEISRHDARLRRAVAEERDSVRSKFSDDLLQFIERSLTIIWNSHLKTICEQVLTLRVRFSLLLG